MKNRIYKGFSILLFVTVFLTALGSTLIFYNNYKKEHEQRLHQSLDFLSFIPYETQGKWDVYFDELKHDFPNLRVTLISPEGKVFYDTDREAANMEDHSKRSEFVEALQKGTGESVRFSQTIGENFYYFAKRLPDGNILRLSEMQANFYAGFRAILWPLIFLLTLALILVFWMGSRVTKGIIGDLKHQVENISSMGEISHLKFRELYPLRMILQEKHEEIQNQMEALEEYKHTVQAMLSNMTEGMLYVDDVNRIVLLNRRTLDLFGKDRKNNFLGRSVFYLSRDPNLMEALSHTRAYVSDTIHIPMGTSMIKASITPVISKGESIGKVIVFRDVTEESILERERKEFTSNVTHELRTPLTSINGYAELLSAGQVQGEDIRTIGYTILEEGKRLLRLIDSILELSKLEEKSGEVPTTFSVEEVVEQCVELYKIRAKDKGVEISRELEPVTYMGNRGIVEEIIRNLIDNAIKYNKENGEVFVGLYDRKTYFLLIVKDTGIGIPEADHEKVFQRFYTVDLSRHKKDSSGLGLSIVKHGVQKLKGKIQLESIEYRGSTFMVEIPYE
ncbi:MAG: ATP-binding protein [Tissierellia bacterium]|nr:ATP-binding protein [Tissierellia bacterium]